MTDETLEARIARLERWAWGDMPPKKPELFCTACGKSQHDTKVLIHVKSTFNICAECVRLCGSIVKENGGDVS